MRSALERRQEILSVLNARRYEKIEILAFEFEVSRDTIERDIRELTFHYPIYTMQGGGGGVFVVEGCSAGRKNMSDKQEELLQRLLAGLDGEDAETMCGILKGFAVPKKGERRTQKSKKGERRTQK